jgi:hypothetical protein
LQNSSPKKVFDTPKRDPPFRIYVRAGLGLSPLTSSWPYFLARLPLSSENLKPRKLLNQPKVLSLMVRNLVRKFSSSHLLYEPAALL